MQNSLVEIQQRYRDCNILMPVSTEVQLNPFYKYTVMEVKADLTDNSGDIFKVGNTKVGDNYVDVFSPSKPLLMKIASAAGIQFDPNNTYGTYISKNCYRAKAYGAMRMPDGTGKTHCDEKTINLEDEEDRFRLEFMDKSIEGIKDKKAAEEAERLFKGRWADSTDKWGKPCKAYIIADEDRQKYIDRSVLVNMTLLRKTFAEKAMTGAILRVIRALTGLKSQYTKKELEKPFAIPRVTFSPDYSDPEVRRAMLDQGMNAVSNMFGSNRMLSAAPMESTVMPGGFVIDDFAGNQAFSSDLSPRQPDHIDATYEDGYGTGDDMSTNDQPSNEPLLDDVHCHHCGREITEAVSKFSKDRYGKPLCMPCQKGA